MIIGIEQMDGCYDYGYEYIGNRKWCIITPLTDRGYFTITQALKQHKFASFRGPAGTGKTETSIDLASHFGQYKVVINCSDQLNEDIMELIFTGIALCGGWAILDEANRIAASVFQIIGQQVQIILDAIKKKESST